MLFKALSAAVYGIDAYLVEVEVDVSAGLGNFLTVGLPDMAVKESKERSKAAIKNCGLDYPANSVWRLRDSGSVTAHSGRGVFYDQQRN